MASVAARLASHGSVDPVGVTTLQSVLNQPATARVPVTHRVVRRARGRARVPREPARVAADGHGAQGAGACFGGFFVNDCVYKNDCVEGR